LFFLLLHFLTLALPIFYALIIIPFLPFSQVKKENRDLLQKTLFNAHRNAVKPRVSASFADSSNSSLSWY
jgi:hypothetical protein